MPRWATFDSHDGYCYRLDYGDVGGGSLGSTKLYSTKEFFFT